MSQGQRILCLHGLCRSGAQAEVREFRHLVRTRAGQLLIPDGFCRLPEEVVAELVPEEFREERPYWAWFRADDSSPPMYRYLEDSMVQARTRLLRPPVEAIVAHSQGALFASLLLAHLGPSCPPLRALVLIGMPLLPRWRLLMDEWTRDRPKLSIPVLFFFGTQDPHVSSNLDELRSTLDRYFETTQFVSYNGGHFPPTLAREWEQVDDFFVAQGI